MLHDAGIPATSGKDIGSTIDGTWQPPREWRHHLMSVGVLADLHESGWTIYPEAQIRRNAGRLVKVPDGLAVKGQEIVWLEVERARKQGRPKVELAKAICTVASSAGVAVLGHRPTMAMVAYEGSQIDERGYQLDHRTNLIRVLEQVAQIDTNVRWACCSMLGAGVASVAYLDETITADRSEAVLHVLNTSGWLQDEDGVLLSSYGQHQAAVWEEDNTWGWQVNTIPAERAETQAAAKRACANLLTLLTH